MTETKYIIKEPLSSKVLMVGNYYKNHHPGGISAVLQYWSEYIENMQHYSTYKLSNMLVRIWLFAFGYMRIVLRLMLDRKVQILHLHCAADASFWRKAQLVRLGKFFKRKVILHIHSSRFKDYYAEATRKKKKWILKTLCGADVVIVLSNSWKEWFVGIGVPSDKLIVLHNITSYPTLVSSAKVDDGKIHLLFMGEIGPRKGVFDVVRSIANHKTDLSRKIVFRIGGNRNEDVLKKMIADANLQDIVNFEGWVGGLKKIELLNWANLFILPSFNEGLPISVLEAMSYRLPIITSAVGGIPEVVSNGENGTIVTPGNDEEIYAAIKKYVDSPQLLCSEGASSYRKAEAYLPEYVIKHLKSIYEVLIM